MQLRNKTVLVFGTGISGIGAADLLEKVKAKPILYDGNEKLTIEEVRAKLPADSNAEIVIGTLDEELLKRLDLAVLSPGVPTDIPSVKLIRDAGVPIWGEIELAYENSRGDVLAITGTNGKTTTTTLVGEIMKRHQKSVYVVGNIGNPYTEVALETTDESVAVAEISSFQLETIDQFHPKVSAITNITPDHLNRHHSMEEYIRVKECITKNQTSEDTCVLNYEDEELRRFGKTLRTKVIFFSSARELEQGIYLKDGKIEAFTAVEHRIEYVAEKNGVVYYNDSKGTNPDAAIRGIRAMDRPTVLIGGGYDKDSSYEEWIQAFDGKVKYLVLVGQTKEKIAKAARSCGFEHILMAETFEEAFALCVEKAQPGDAVLLSPACASWGMFPNYEVRGKVFKELVHALP